MYSHSLMPTLSPRRLASSLVLCLALADNLYASPSPAGAPSSWLKGLGETWRAASGWLRPTPSSTRCSTLTRAEVRELVLLLDEAGYHYVGVEKAAEGCSAIRLRFHQVRELTTADVDHLLQRLDRLGSPDSTLARALRQSVVAAVTVINHSSDYRIAALQLQLRPAPRLGLVLQARSLTLDDLSLTRSLDDARKSARLVGR